MTWTKMPRASSSRAIAFGSVSLDSLVSNRTAFSLPHISFLVSSALILALGVLMVFDTSAAEVMDRGRAVSTHAALCKQVAYALIGLAVGFAVWLLGAEAILRLAPLAMTLCLILLTLVAMPGIGEVHHGARRWLGVGPLGCQPSELMKVCLPLYALQWLKKGKLNWKQAVTGSCSCAAAVVLVLVEPDKKSAALLGMGLLVVLFMTAIPFRYWLLPMVGLAVIGAAAAWHSPYAVKRVAAYLHPDADLQGSGHQPYQARIAAGSGGLWGKGVGQSLQKLSYLPEAQNDYIAAVFAEEFGFLGSLVLILLYVIMAAAGFVIAQTAASQESMRLAAVLTFLLVVQACLNLGVVSGLAPTTGLNLPFFSQGGTSLLANISAAALILSVEPCRRQRSSLLQEEQAAI
jgi:cell division protein FtsW